jgi:hypothetical protein
MIFYERDYKYGSDRSLGRGPSGCPPLLGNGVRVCQGDSSAYVQLANYTVGLIRDAMRETYPEMGFQPRTGSHDFQEAAIKLIFAVYFLQEYMPGGSNHALYKAATMPTVAEFRAAVEAYCIENRLAALSLNAMH